MNYKLVLDQGGENARALIVDDCGALVNACERDFSFIPIHGKMEETEDVWETQLAAVRDVISSTDIALDELSSFCIINRQQQVLLWSRDTGRLVDTQPFCHTYRTSVFIRKQPDQLDGFKREICEHTGLPLNYAFNAKFFRRFDVFPRYFGLADDVYWGTEDIWLIFRLTDGREHVTDLSHALGTALVDPETQDWNSEAMDPGAIARFPRIIPDGTVIGETSPEYFGRPIPIVVGATEEPLGISTQGA
jgi:glycerol kinase